MRHRLIVVGLTAAAVGVASGSAQAAQTLPLKGAYLYVDRLPSSGRSVVRLVFRTARPLPRRSDGGLRAAALIENVGHSVRPAKRGSTCYMSASPVEGGSIPTISGNSVVRKGAKPGSTFAVQVLTNAAQSRTLRLKLRTERAGYHAGRPLGC